MFLQLPIEPRAIPKLLFILMLVYGTATLIHFVHNAELLADYPNMPAWITRTQVYLAWLGLTAIGGLGYVLLRYRYRFAGLFFVALYAFLGLDSLGHYALAPMSAHTTTMNVTILLDVTAAALLLITSLGFMTQQILRRAP
jgi:hypothetical protein